MSHLHVTDLSYAHPGGDTLFYDVTFKLAPGKHAGLVGVNGVGKSTLLRIITGDLSSDTGDFTAGGRILAMPQDVGTGEGTVRELLLMGAPPRTRAIGERLLECERQLAAGDEEAGIRLGELIGEWSDVGGYELEGQWDAVCRRITRAGLSEVGDRPSTTLSGGERKRLVLELLLTSDATVLLLDEPDNFLDIPAKRWLEGELRKTKKTILLISHDRELLAAATDTIVTLEAGGAWVHDGSYATYAEARAKRQKQLGDRLAQWNEEEKRLRDLVRIFKERARYSPDLAKRASAFETRHKRFVAEGPPPAPVTDKSISVRLIGGDSARKVVTLDRVEIDGLVKPFSDEIHFGERVGLIGPNGSGKTHVMGLLGGADQPAAGRVMLGNRVSPGLFTQLNRRDDFDGRTLADIVEERTGAYESAMRGLARYGLQEADNRRVETLSGGQRARLEILCLELEGHNLLLLDEPTDNLDVESCEALEHALDGFTGTVVAVSHDRAFLRKLDRFLLLDHQGRVTALPDVRSALEALGAGVGSEAGYPA